MGNISDWIRDHAAARPDAPAIQSYDGNGWSYAALQLQIRRWARLLQTELKITAGDRVAFLGYNNRETLAHGQTMSMRTGRKNVALSRR